MVEATWSGSALIGIEGLFKKAQVQKPVLRLDAFKFKPAPDTGKYPGAVYVTDANTSEYLGRIHEGKFIKTRSATPEIEQRILEAAASPQEAAVKYGKMTGRCSVCGHKLDNPKVALEIVSKFFLLGRQRFQR
jgi:hypothetical protein